MKFSLGLLDAKLSDNRMNELHWRLLSSRHRRLSPKAWYTLPVSTARDLHGRHFRHPYTARGHGYCVYTEHPCHAMRLCQQGPWTRVLGTYLPESTGRGLSVYTGCGYGSYGPWTRVVCTEHPRSRALLAKMHRMTMLFANTAREHGCSVYTHYPCPRAVYGCLKWRPCKGVNHGPWTRVLCTDLYTAIVSENHLHFVIGRHVACKRLVNVYKFRVNVYSLSRQAHP